MNTLCIYFAVSRNSLDYEKHLHIIHYNIILYLNKFIFTKHSCKMGFRDLY